jgi:hypothetical protein
MNGGRYESSPKQTYISPGGMTIVYLAPRMLSLAPPASTATTRIADGEVDRLDLVANRTLGNPLLAWRIADVNNAIDPFGLCATAGRRIDVPGTGL